MPFVISDALIGEPLRLLGNVRAVEPGMLYRSATLSPPVLRYVIRHYQLRSILNLRGAELGERWYQEESGVVRAAGVTLIDFPMADYLVPSSAELSQLLSILRNAARPLLVHCRIGADRTGLACALFELAVLGKPAEVARRQLNWRYGHVPWLDGRSYAMDRAFAEVANGTMFQP